MSGRANTASFCCERRRTVGPREVTSQSQCKPGAAERGTRTPARKDGCFRAYPVGLEFAVKRQPLCLTADAKRVSHAVDVVEPGRNHRDLQDRTVVEPCAPQFI